MDWSFLLPDLQGWGPALMRGAVVTLQIAAGAYLLGLLIGSLTAWARLRGARPIAAVASFYTTACRAIPELLLILLMFYAGADLLNWIAADLLNRGPVTLDGFWAAVVVLGVVQGAYIGEVLRGAALAVPAGQIESARALGMGRLLTVRRVLLPAMLPFALGGLSNLWLIVLKDTALISVVGYSELFFTARQAAGATREYLLFYTVVGLIYLTMTLFFTGLFRLLERRYERWTPALHSAS